MKTKRNTKDSVFCCLFSNPEYQLQLYKELNPGSDIMIEDIHGVTLDNEFAMTEFNDLGFIVKDEILFLIEAQSIESENIFIRMIFYYKQVLKRRILEEDWNIYSSLPFPIMKPRFYVIYTGDKKVGDILRFKDTFFSGDIDIQVHILRDTNEIEKISVQYILFSKIFDEQRKLHGNTKKTIEETLRVCTNEHILESFLQSNKKEIVNMMFVSLDKKRAMEYALEKVREFEKTCGVYGRTNLAFIHRLVIQYEEYKKNARELNDIEGIQHLARLSRNVGYSEEDSIAEIQEMYLEFDSERIQQIITYVYKEN